jgi:hypothetical protein
MGSVARIRRVHDTGTCWLTQCRGHDKVSARSLARRERTGWYGKHPPSRVLRQRHGGYQPDGRSNTPRSDKDYDFAVRIVSIRHERGCGCANSTFVSSMCRLEFLDSERDKLLPLQSGECHSKETPY